MKIRLILYRLITVILIISLFISFNLYQNKKCIKVEKIINPNYVFLGDSITNFYNIYKYYSDEPVVNSGIGGNTTTDILNSLESRVYNYNPTKIILLIGINDLNSGADYIDVIKNIEEICTNINKKNSQVDIYIQSIYPVNYKWKDVTENETIIKTNEKIRELCEKKNYIYIDVYSKLIDKDKELSKNYTKDGLHLNEDGYKVVTEVIKEKIY